MVKPSILFNNVEGRIYLIPLNSSGFIGAQVGYGGDLGVFAEAVSQDSELSVLSASVMFRVQYGLVSPKKFKWIDCGLFLYKDSLRHPQSYLYQPVGTEECYLVTYESPLQRVACSEASKYEPLATWSHEHIIHRYLRNHATT